MTLEQARKVLSVKGYVWSMKGNKPCKLRVIDIWQHKHMGGWMVVKVVLVDECKNTMHQRHHEEIFHTKIELRDQVFGTEMDILVEDPIF